MNIQNLDTILGPFLNDDFNVMKKVLEKAKEAFDKGEVPVGAAIVYKDEIIAINHNRVEEDKLATSHAEMLVIKEASQVLGDWRLEGCTLYSSLEPCVMCMGAIMQARFKRLVWGAKDIRLGGDGSFVQLISKEHPMHKLKIASGLFEVESSALLQQFFQLKRQSNDKRKTR